MAVVLMVACMIGCERRSVSAMFRKRVEGNPMCAEKLLSSR